MIILCGETSQVIIGRFKKKRIVAKETDADITFIAQNAAHSPRIVVVINPHFFDSGEAPLANGALSQSLFFVDVMSKVAISVFTFKNFDHR